MTTLAIAVTTYNHGKMVRELCARLRRLTQTPFRLVIGDDGSSDGTAATLYSQGETVIGGRNGGVARNKNRGICYLTVAERVASFRVGVLPTIQALQAEGRSLRGITDELNARGIKALCGLSWYPTTVRVVMQSGRGI